MSIQENFLRFHKENPHVYEMFKRFAFDAIEAKLKTLSANFIFERIRWETDVVTKGDQFKLNNNYRAYYARMFMDQYPNAPEFRIREQVAA